MHDERNVRLTVDVERVAEPITGVVIIDGLIRQFQGWTAFASAVEWALARGESGGNRAAEEERFGGAEQNGSG